MKDSITDIDWSLQHFRHSKSAKVNHN